MGELVDTQRPDMHKKSKRQLLAKIGHKRGGKRFAALLFVMAVFGAGGVYMLTQTKSAVTYQDRAGFAANSRLLMESSDSDLNRDMDAMAATGAQWIRFDFDWGKLEPSKGSYNWSRIDRAVNAAQSRGLKVIGMIGYTPDWARPAGTTDKTPPTNMDDYANFTRAVVQRYAPKGVKHWEVWNEPNIVVFWHPQPNVGQYVAMLKKSIPGH